MEVYNHQSNLYFGEKITVPTKVVLKVATGICNVDDAKDICQLCRKKFVGHIGYYKTAIKIVEDITKKNNDLRELVTKIIQKQPDNRLVDIDEIVKTRGEFLNVEI